MKEKRKGKTLNVQANSKNKKNFWASVPSQRSRKKYLTDQCHELQ